MSTTNYVTLDQGRIDRNYCARLIRVCPRGKVAPDDFVVAVYKDAGAPDWGPGYYHATMHAVEHFADEYEATGYFLALMDPYEHEFGDPEEVLLRSKSRDVSRAYRWTPDAEVARRMAAESFRREVAR